MRRVVMHDGAMASGAFRTDRFSRVTPWYGRGRRDAAGIRLTLFLACAAVGMPGWSQAVERQVTEGQQQQWVADFLTQHLLKIERQGTHVHCVSDGQLGIIETVDGRTEWREEFVLAVGEAFSGSPDHHSTLAFKIREIRETGVTISYESMFDHRSFGPDRITVDRGTVTVPYTPTAAPLLTGNECAQRGGQIVNTLGGQGCPSPEAFLGTVTGMRCPCVCCRAEDR